MGTSATATCSGRGAAPPANRASSPTRTAIAACACTDPARNAPAFAPCTAARGTSRPSTAQSATRQASERITSVRRCNATSAANAAGEIARSASPSSSRRVRQIAASATSAPPISSPDTAARTVMTTRFPCTPRDPVNRV